MIQKARRKASPGTKIYLDALKSKSGTLEVLWYGGVVKNVSSTLVPLVAVFFRWSKRPKAFERIDVALTDLTMLRIHSKWEAGRCIEITELVVKTFEVNFGPDHCIPLKSGILESDNELSSLYPFSIELANSNLVLLRDTNGTPILIPCMEFFTRTYGRSQELRRVLVMNEWEEVQKDVYAPLDDSIPPNDDRWYIKLNKRMYNDDAVFLAHMKYDSFTAEKAKYIHSQFMLELGEGVKTSTGNRRVPAMAFPKIGPWFLGQATIKVSGRWIDGVLGRTFLALRIDGISDPTGVAIDRDRAGGGGSRQPMSIAPDGRGGEDGTFFARPKAPDIVTITHAQEPEGQSGSVEVIEPSIVLIGPPRAVYAVNQKGGKPVYVTTPSQNEKAVKVAPGEGRGRGNGIRRESGHTPEAVERKGVRREIWESALALKADGTIDSVDCLYFKENGELGFANELTQITLVSRKTSDEQPGIDSLWVYFDPLTGQVRGLSIIRITVESKVVYLVEIQRRIILSREKAAQEQGSEQGNSNLEHLQATTSIPKVNLEKEESFSGLLCILAENHSLIAWVESLRTGIIKHKGVMSYLSTPNSKTGPERSMLLKHQRNGTDDRLYTVALTNALGRFGIVREQKPSDQEF